MEEHEIHFKSWLISHLRRKIGRQDKVDLIIEQIQKNIITDPSVLDGATLPQLVAVLHEANVLSEQLVEEVVTVLKMPKEEERAKAAAHPASIDARSVHIHLQGGADEELARSSREKLRALIGKVVQSYDAPNTDPTPPAING